MASVENSAALQAEESGINTENEGSLHAAIKRWYAQPGDRLEAMVDGYIVDIVRGETLIEVQTGGFASIRRKLERLVENHSVRLVYPIPQQRWIVKLDPVTGQRISRRKSPKRGKLTDIFGELVRIPHLMDHPNLELLVLMIDEDQIRCADGRGSWRRGRVSIVDRELVQVLDSVTFRCKEDLLRLLPDDLSETFTNRDLAESMRMRIAQVRRMTYSLRKMGALRHAGRRGREMLFSLGGGGWNERSE